ncbi:hypothetical protein HYH03_007444 [Edaphochlamys debaryana]|uniref:Uncharacterized protein n=1 Tax=Edaphochlamys debaryana TaxID=47281 RepID=A0A835Y581_9CHLO|nr:hypothetical protein HYH03_007444 [Edaphochlamys debaryana]|eukprot:KAG2494391.1 hypothetical protein HYH03_007444 [Edaphochlamys debaryana]
MLPGACFSAAAVVAESARNPELHSSGAHVSAPNTQLSGPLTGTMYPPPPGSSSEEYPVSPPAAGALTLADLQLVAHAPKKKKRGLLRRLIDKWRVRLDPQLLAEAEAEAEAHQRRLLEDQARLAQQHRQPPPPHPHPQHHLPRPAGGTAYGAGGTAAALPPAAPAAPPLVYDPVWTTAHRLTQQRTPYALAPSSPPRSHQPPPAQHLTPPPPHHSPQLQRQDGEHEPEPEPEPPSPPAERRLTSIACRPLESHVRREVAAGTADGSTAPAAAAAVAEPAAEPPPVPENGAGRLRQDSAASRLRDAQRPPASAPAQPHAPIPPPQPWELASGYTDAEDARRASLADSIAPSLDSAAPHPTHAAALPPHHPRHGQPPRRHAAEPPTAAPQPIFEDPALAAAAAAAAMAARRYSMRAESTASTGPSLAPMPAAGTGAGAGAGAGAGEGEGAGAVSSVTSPWRMGPASLLRAGRSDEASVESWGRRRAGAASPAPLPQSSSSGSRPPAQGSGRGVADAVAAVPPPPPPPLAAAPVAAAVRPAAAGVDPATVPFTDGSGDDSTFQTGESISSGGDRQGLDAGNAERRAQFAVAPDSGGLAPQLTPAAGHGAGAGRGSAQGSTPRLRAADFVFAVEEAEPAPSTEATTQDGHLSSQQLPLPPLPPLPASQEQHAAPQPSSSGVEGPAAAAPGAAAVPAVRPPRAVAAEAGRSRGQAPVTHQSAPLFTAGGPSGGLHDSASQIHAPDTLEPSPPGAERSTGQGRGPPIEAVPRGSSDRTLWRPQPRAKSSSAVGGVATLAPSTHPPTAPPGVPNAAETAPRQPPPQEQQQQQQPPPAAPLPVDLAADAGDEECPWKAAAESRAPRSPFDSTWPAFPERGPQPLPPAAKQPPAQAPQGWAVATVQGGPQRATDWRDSDFYQPSAERRPRRESAGSGHSSQQRLPPGLAEARGSGPGRMEGASQAAVGGRGEAPWPAEVPWPMAAGAPALQPPPASYQHPHAPAGHRPPPPQPAAQPRAAAHAQHPPPHRAPPPAAAAAAAAAHSGGLAHGSAAGLSGRQAILDELDGLLAAIADELVEVDQAAEQVNTRMRLVAALLDSSAAAPGAAAAPSSSPEAGSALEAGLRAEAGRLRRGLAELAARQRLLRYAAAEWGKVKAVMAGVRVSRRQAGPLQAILFSDTLARIRGFQRDQQQELGEPGAKQPADAGHGAGAGQAQPPVQSGTLFSMTPPRAPGAPSSHRRSGGGAGSPAAAPGSAPRSGGSARYRGSPAGGRPVGLSPPRGTVSRRRLQPIAENGQEGSGRPDRGPTPAERFGYEMQQQQGWAQQQPAGGGGYEAMYGGAGAYGSGGFGDGDLYGGGQYDAAEEVYGYLEQHLSAQNALGVEPLADSYDSGDGDESGGEGGGAAAGGWGQGGGGEGEVEGDDEGYEEGEGEEEDEELQSAFLASCITLARTSLDIVSAAYGTTQTRGSLPYTSTRGAYGTTLHDGAGGFGEEEGLVETLDIATPSGAYGVGRAGSGSSWPPQSPLQSPNPARPVHDVAAQAPQQAARGSLPWALGRAAGGGGRVQTPPGKGAGGPSGGGPGGGSVPRQPAAQLPAPSQRHQNPLYERQQQQQQQQQLAAQHYARQQQPAQQQHQQQPLPSQQQQGYGKATHAREAYGGGGGGMGGPPHAATRRSSIDPLGRDLSPSSSRAQQPQLAQRYGVYAAPPAGPPAHGRHGAPTGGPVPGGAGAGNGSGRPPAPPGYQQPHQRPYAQPPAEAAAPGARARPRGRERAAAAQAAVSEWLQSQQGA